MRFGATTECGPTHVCSGLRVPVRSGREQSLAASAHVGVCACCRHLSPIPKLVCASGQSARQRPRLSAVPSVTNTSPSEVGPSVWAPDFGPSCILPRECRSWDVRRRGRHVRACVPFAFEGSGDRARGSRIRPHQRQGGGRGCGCAPGRHRLNWRRGWIAGNRDSPGTRRAAVAGFRLVRHAAILILRPVPKPVLPRSQKHAGMARRRARTHLQPRHVRAGAPAPLPRDRPLAGRALQGAVGPDPVRLADHRQLRLPCPRGLRAHPGVIKLHSGEYKSLGCTSSSTRRWRCARRSSVTPPRHSGRTCSSSTRSRSAQGRGGADARDAEGAGARLVLGLRDIMDEPTLLSREWKRST